jgi:tetratricopeptide (TPR) repeat protein
MATRMSGGPISVPDSWTIEALLGAGWSAEDLEWENVSEAGLERLAEGRLPEAAKHWAQAVRTAHGSFAPNDPRLGTSLFNHGAALIAAGEEKAAGRTLADAAEVWRRADSWVAAMTAPRVARSSLFHMRMEQLHRHTYEERWRVKWAELVAEARGQIVGSGPLKLVCAEAAGDRLGRWRRERPAMLNDTRKLMAAVLLLACARV